jgi:flagellar assembly factor FliW
VKVDTTRFGTLEVEKCDIITVKDGILGFEQLKRFFIVDPGDQTLILWLQSIEDNSVAFPIIEPKFFRPDYSIKLLPAELASLELTDLNDTSVYSILTIPKVVSEMSANLKAPIIINNKTKIARQIVLQNNKLEVQFPMYKELRRYIVDYTSDDSIRTTASKAENIEAAREDDTVHAPEIASPSMTERH